MQRAKTNMLKRPQSAAGRTARTSKKAAIDLVRIEFDVRRLYMGIEQAENRIDTYNQELEQKLVERRRLLSILAR